ncbi:hypothetical protein B7P43_G18153 [Cryptotermes secundus]|uniref:Endonuclease/exonuclease/phosphatase domain-containing protein n=1 Tax=Cryptotermes secundus TaxID=105785 RepID=A0A2J7RB70_9NEOP|nr:hypothetical protein B7P43_G18153 [Cryptotermes secundus]
MVEYLTTSVKEEQYYCKTLSNGTIRVNTSTSDSYRRLIKLLHQDKIVYHTYQLREERAYRVVIRNLHPSIPAETIKQEIVKHRHTVRNVRNIRLRATKEPFYIYKTTKSYKPQGVSTISEHHPTKSLSSINSAKSKCQSIRFALWNANGLLKHKLELENFLNLHKIDVALISETHFTTRTMLKIQSYKIYHIPHPDDTAHGGAAVIIRSTIPHHELPHYQTPKIQAANIQINASPWPFTTTAIYCPPRHSISTEEYIEFLQSQGNKFLIGGDWNAKNTAWGARLSTPKGRNLLKALIQQNCNYLSTGVPTYWPTDPNKLPDLLDFFINKGVTSNYIQVEPNFELSSDHSPVIATLSSHIISKPSIPTLFSKNTDWNSFHNYLENNINLKIRIKDTDELDEAVQNFTTLIQQAACMLRLAYFPLIWKFAQIIMVPKPGKPINEVIQPWGCAKPSNTQIIQRLQSRVLRTITNAPWYVSNRTLHNDLEVPYVTDEIRRLALLYKQRLQGHDNRLIEEIRNPPNVARRLKRQWPPDLPKRQN